MDERAAGAAVAVGERVERLELGVGDRRLNERGMVVAVDIGKEIVEQRVEGVRWRGDERGGAWIVAAAADLFLHRADRAGDRWCR